MSDKARIENATAMLSALSSLFAEIPSDADLVLGDEERAGIALIMKSIECVLKGEKM